jgi:hypothetical protein
MEFTIGELYTREEIQTAFGGEIQSYLPQTGGRIVSGCFGLHFNPDAPQEIQVGSKPKVIQKAKTLSEQQDRRIPIFVKITGIYDARKWRYQGVFEFVELVDDQEALDAAEAISGRHGVLAYLLRLRPVQSE